MPNRHPCIVSPDDIPEQRGRYPKSDELLAFARPIGKQAGLLRIGLHFLRLPPGARTSWPHCEEKDEEFVFVVQGECDLWLDGHLYPMKTGDLAAFPSGTGMSHCVINNGERDVLLIGGGEADHPDNRIFYPLHPGRRDDMKWSQWWDDVPARPLGPHDGLPDALRARAATPRRAVTAAGARTGRSRTRPRASR